MQRRRRSVPDLGEQMIESEAEGEPGGFVRAGDLRAGAWHQPSVLLHRCLFPLQMETFLHSELHRSHYYKLSMILGCEK
jgi:hypothetical protein